MSRDDALMKRKPRKRGMPTHGRIVFSSTRLASLPRVANVHRMATYLNIDHKTIHYWLNEYNADIAFGGFVDRAVYRKIKIDKYKLIAWLCETGRAPKTICKDFKDRGVWPRDVLIPRGVPQ